MNSKCTLSIRYLNNHVNEKNFQRYHSNLMTVFDEALHYCVLLTYGLMQEMHMQVYNQKVKVQCTLYVYSQTEQ